MPPDETLYIYEIQGHFPKPNDSFSDSFIGCWYEDDFSFLFFSSPKAEEVRFKTSISSGLTYRSEAVLDYKNWETGKEYTSFRVGNFFIFDLSHHCSILS